MSAATANDRQRFLRFISYGSETMVETCLRMCGSGEWGLGGGGGGEGEETQDILLYSTVNVVDP
jgi:hypothetical protein